MQVSKKTEKKLTRTKSGKETKKKMTDRDKFTLLL